MAARAGAAYMTDEGDVRVNVPVISWADLLDASSSAPFAPGEHCKLGEGGMGAVFRARLAPTSEWRSLHRGAARGGAGTVMPVAVKTVKAEEAGGGGSGGAASSGGLDPASMMRRELKQHFAVRRHPNVVNVLGMCRGSSPASREGYAIVMELLSCSLGDAIEEKDGGRWRALPLSERLRRCGGLVSAIEAVHAIGMVHADVKPANVLLDDTSRLHLADFGVATVERTTRDARVLQQFFAHTQRTVAATLAGRGEMFSALGVGMSALKVPRGTPVYMPPEVLASKSPNTAASDVYAVALTVTEAITCSDAVTRQIILGLLLGCPMPPRTDSIPEEVPLGLRAALIRAMSPKAEERPTAQQLRQEFERACGPLGVPAAVGAPSGPPSSLSAGESYEALHCTAGQVGLATPLRLLSKHGFSSAVLQRPVQRGRWYFEADVVQCTGVVQVGWADVEFRGNSGGGAGVGDDSHSWAFDPHRGAKWHAARKIPYGRTCSPGDVVGCLLDADTKRVEFSLNGSFDPPFGAAFLDMMPMDDAFLPAVSLSAHGAEVQLRIDAAALRFRPPHGARPIGEAPARGLSVARQAIDLQVGTHVRLRAAVTEPRYGMGRLRRGEVGVVQKVTGEVVRINFPLAGMWNGLSSELEPATCFVVGDMVQVKAGVGEPRYGWGEIQRGDLLQVTTASDMDDGVSKCAARILRGGREVGRPQVFVLSELEFATTTGCQCQRAAAAAAPSAPARTPPRSPAAPPAPAPVDAAADLSALLQAIGIGGAASAPAGGQAAEGTRMEGAALVPREFPPGFVACRDHEPDYVDLRVGHWVRVRRTVTKTYYGWGKTCHGEIGRIIETDKDGDPVVKFPSCDRFTCEWAELQMAVYLQPGDAVTWRASVRQPKYGWGGVARDEVGVVRAVDPQFNVAIVRFGQRSKIVCEVSELAWTQQPSPAARRGALPVGARVRIREHVVTTRYGDGKARRGEVGVVVELDGDGDPIVDWPSHKRWQSSYTDLEDAGTWCVGDLVQLKSELTTATRTYPAGLVGILINIESDGRLRVEFEHSYLTLPPQHVTDAATSPTDQGLYNARPLLPGTLVRLRSTALSSPGLNQDQVGVVVTARMDDSERFWNTTVSFPGDHAWTGKAQHLHPHRSKLMKGDWVCLAPTLKKPMQGWGDAAGKVRHGDVGVVEEVKEVPRRSGKKAVVYVVVWPSGHRLSMVYCEVVPAGKPPAGR